MTHSTINLYHEAPVVPTEGDIDLDGWLQPPGDIELEIGFGRGRFLLDRAAANPGHRFFGFETRRKWVQVVSERSRQLQLANVDVRLGDVRRALPRIKKAASIARVFINFPDPWWKTRHLKRQVISGSLVSQLTRLLIPNGEIFVQTDVADRAATYLGVLRQTPLLRSDGDNGTVAENPFGAQSLRERQCERVGLPIYRMLFRRR